MLTQSEIIATSKKATRGAGFAWGMAEEAAWACNALFNAGQNGFDPLLEILENADDANRPIDAQCGLALGVYYMDCHKSDHGAPENIIGKGIFYALLGAPNKYPNPCETPAKFPTRLLEFAARTYVPESAESRLKGAGEG